MELCSLFQDLVYSIEIAAHDAGLEHYAPRMYFDAVTVRQRYQESFVPEEWALPFDVWAEISFELGPLDIARWQRSDQDIAAALGLQFDDAVTDELESLRPIVVDIEVRFILAVSKLQASSGHWDDYCHAVAERDLLQAGLENLNRKLQRAIGEEGADQRPRVRVKARADLTDSGQVVLGELVGLWLLSVDAGVADEVRQAVLEDMMNCVHAGLDAVDEFAQDIQKDFGSSSVLAM